MQDAAELNLDCSFENYQRGVATQPLTVYNHLQNTHNTGTWHIDPSSIHPSIFFFLSLFSHLQSFFSALRFLFFFLFLWLLLFSPLLFQLLRLCSVCSSSLGLLAWGFRWSLLLVKSAFLEFASHPPFFPPFFFLPLC